MKSDKEINMQFTEEALKVMDWFQNDDETEDVPEFVENFWEGFQSTEGFYHIFFDGDPTPLLVNMYDDEADVKAILEARRLIDAVEQDYLLCFPII